MKNNENREICSKCGGNCCRRMPGQYVPDDLFDHEMTKEELKKFILEVGNISIDCWNADDESDYKDYYYLRPMRRKLTLKESIDNIIKVEGITDKSKAEKLIKATNSILKYSIRNFAGQDLTVDYAYPEYVLLCCHLTVNGCDLKFDKRPANCRELIPSEEECYIEGNKDKTTQKLYYAKKWEKYNEMLHDIAYEIEYGNDYEEYFGKED